MILGTITMTNVFVANAAGIDDNLVFDLDISGDIADGEITTNTGLTNVEATGEDKSAEITYVKMKKGSETISEQQKINYVQSAGGTYGIDVVNAAINESPDITLEAWVKESGTVVGHMFLYGNKSTSSGGSGSWQLGVASAGSNIQSWVAQSSWNNNATKTSAQFAADTTKWRHLVVTLDRDEESKNRTITVYVDGALAAGGVAQESDVVYSKDADGTNPPFRISGGNFSSQGSNTKFADVKLYTGLMTEDEAKAKYDSEVEKYTSTVVDEEEEEEEEAVPIENNLVFDLDLSGYKTDDAKFGLKNGKTETADDISTVAGITKGTETPAGGTAFDYIDIDATTTKPGIGVINTEFNNSPDITIETWTKTDATGGHMFLYGASSPWGIEVQFASGNLQFKNKVADSAISKGITLNQWNHIVATIDRDANSTAATMNVYINGESIGTKTYNHTANFVGNANDILRISGGLYTDSVKYDGKFAEVKLYKAVMTAEEAMDHYIDGRDKYREKKMVFSLDLSAYDEEGTDVKGIKNGVTGNTSTLSAVNTPKVVETDEINDEAVKYLQPVSPEGTYSGAIKVVDSAIVKNTGLTIESWIRWDPNRNSSATASGGNNGHLAMLSKGSAPHSIQLQEISLKTFRANMVTMEVSTDPTIPIGDVYSDKWIHYVATRDYDETTNTWTGKVYVNGEPVNDPITRVMPDPTKPFLDDTNYYLVIGGYNGASTAFNGDIGTFNVYNYALTETDAAAKYEAEKGTWEQKANTEWADAEYGDDLVFDLNIGDYDRTNKTGLTNAATEFAGTGSISFPDSTAPILVTEENAKGETLKSLRFINDDAAATPAGGVQINQPEAMGKNAITVELWAKHTPMTNGNGFGMMLALPNHNDYSLQILRSNTTTQSMTVKPFGSGQLDDNPSAAVNPGGLTWTLDEKANADEWTHYAITRKIEKQTDGSYKWTAKFYINGVEHSSVHEYTPESPLQYETEAHFFKLGQHKSLPFEGNIGDFKVYNYAKEGSAIASTYTAEKEIWDPFVAKEGQFFDLDIDKYNTTTKKIENSIAYNNSDIAVSGTPALVKENTTAGVRKSLRFINPGEPTEDDPETPADESKTDTAAGYFSVKDSDMVGKDALSIEAWIKFDKSLLDSASAGAGHIFMLNNEGKNKYSIQILRDNTSVCTKPFGSFDTSGATQRSVNMDEWTHLAIVREKVEIEKEGQPDIAWNATIYVNGEVLVNFTEIELEELANGFLDDETYKLDVGAYGKNGTYFPGNLGDLKMYNDKRTEAEVKASYDATKALYRAEIVDGAICVGNTRYLNKDSVEIENLISTDDIVTAKCKIINYTEAAVTPGVALLGYYENDVLQKVVVDTTNVTAFGTIQPLATSAEYSITIEGIAPKAGSYLRLFVWDGLDTLAPVVVNETDMKLEYSEDAAND